jgi:hypothetical protein
MHTTLVSNQRITDAGLLILHKHLYRYERPIRSLVDDDFERIRKAKKKIAHQWYLKKFDGRTQYHTMRSEMLDHWAKKHNWHITTRNLYSSILSKLTVWEKPTGVSKTDQALLNTLRPGAQLFLQFFRNYHPVLT